jgi:tetratricopeptide (TPR) repeat protein
LAVAVFVLALPLLLAQAELAEWIRDLEAGSQLEKIFFRLVPMPGGSVPARRPPAEARAGLSQLIAGTPVNARLYALRARQAERQLDFVAAESDWKKNAELSADRALGQLALADFNHRRLRPREEVLALVAAAQASSPTREHLLPANEQQAWRAFERALKVIEAHALPAAVSGRVYQTWLARYPRRPEVHERYFDFLLAQEDYPAAEAFLASYRQTFPEDSIFPVKARASLERRRGSVEEALSVYDRAFEPLWPPELVQSYFNLLRETRRLRDFLDRARTARATDPDDLNATCRIFYYYQQQANLAAAQHALVEFRQDKETRPARWTTEELFTLARLFEAVHNYDEAARFYYALYSLPEAGADGPEKGLAGLIDVLLTAPEQPIRLGAADLSFYRDVAALDPYPGFLNGILSLLFNSVNPAQHYATQDRSSLAYFHRARAAEMLVLFDSRLADSGERPELHAKLLEAYATYGDSQGVIRGAGAFLAAFPAAPQRTRVALLLAEAFARTEQVEEEFATYDRLLEELAARADGVPLGRGITQDRRQRAALGARSPDYARVLDRYIARLVSLKRRLDALALYRREIDRNPDDPGLYERLAAFLEQNHLGDEVEQVYRRALERFDDRSWYHRLARWYLRRKRRVEFDQLTREVVRIFSGGELEDYFRQVVGRGTLDPLLYRQVNLYAHDRFPHNLTFVRNLLAAYRSRGTHTGSTLRICATASSNSSPSGDDSESNSTPSALLIPQPPPADGRS